MAGELELVEISLLSGWSDRPALTFTPGTPANPVSVGTAGQWTVKADGVNPVHLYLVFDGRLVHVAAASASALPLLAGTPVGTAWVKAAIPCELRFGGACLIMRYAPRGRAMDEEERTVHDGGALLQAAQRAVQDAVDRAKQPGGPSGGHQDLGKTVPFDNEAFRAAVAKVSSSAPPPNAEDSPTTVRAPVAGAAFGGRPGGHPLEATMAAPAGMLQRAPSASSPPGAASAPPPPGQHPPGGSPSANTTSPPAAEAKGYWQSASAVKKATLILMPFALVMSYLMLQPEPAAPPAKVIAGAGAGKHATSGRDGGPLAAGATSGVDGGSALIDASADAGAVAADQAATTDNAAPDVAPGKAKPLPPGRRTPERQALDTAAAGSFDEAAKLYSSLAAAHPDDPSYKDAARILRLKAGHSE